MPLLIFGIITIFVIVCGLYYLNVPFLPNYSDEEKEVKLFEDINKYRAQNHKDPLPRLTYYPDSGLTYRGTISDPLIFPASTSKRILEEIEKSYLLYPAFGIYIDITTQGHQTSYIIHLFTVY